jgi:hypothetical protein
MDDKEKLKKLLEIVNNLSNTITEIQENTDTFMEEIKVQIHSLNDRITNFEKIQEETIKNKNIDT